ncbi:MAG TPA: hypothetical protein P5200_05425 [Tenuifilaceae bacterium]|nr:hypothetical protein [Tenuifilaceae bacterium]HPQ34394.1 hypothetical protein [Tenuifilaceae bacterium]HRX67790.1 hypothetical protein [Tenuifilaceae bacterium]
MENAITLFNNHHFFWMFGLTLISGYITYKFAFPPESINNKESKYYSKRNTIKGILLSVYSVVLLAQLIIGNYQRAKSDKLTEELNIKISSLNETNTDLMNDLQKILVQLDPFTKIAKSKYPNLSDTEALAEFTKEIKAYYGNNLFSSSSFYMDKESMNTVQSNIDLMVYEICQEFERVLEPETSNSKEISIINRRNNAKRGSNNFKYPTRWEVVYNLNINEIKDLKDNTLVTSTILKNIIISSFLKQNIKKINLHIESNVKASSKQILKTLILKTTIIPMQNNEYKIVMDVNDDSKMVVAKSIKYINLKK